MKKSLLTRQEKGFIKSYVTLRKSRNDDFQEVENSEYEVSKMLKIKMTLENRLAVDEYLTEMVGKVYFNDTI